MMTETRKTWHVNFRYCLCFLLSSLGILGAWHTALVKSIKAAPRMRHIMCKPKAIHVLLPSACACARVRSQLVARLRAVDRRSTARARPDIAIAQEVDKTRDRPFRSVQMVRTSSRSQGYMTTARPSCSCHRCRTSGGAVSATPPAVSHPRRQAAWTRSEARAPGEPETGHLDTLSRLQTGVCRPNLQ